MSIGLTVRVKDEMHSDMGELCTIGLLRNKHSFMQQ
jgi:hypothetical protein